MILYLLMCMATFLAGTGFLRLIGLRVPSRAALYMAPAVTLALWTIYLALGMSMGLPVKHLWMPGWLLTGLLALFGILGVERRALKGEWPLLVLVTLLPVGLMAPYFWHGIRTYLGSPLPDGWSYIAYGQYLWEYPRGTEGGLAPLNQYAAHLSRTRFVGPALLAFLSPVVGSAGDTQSASGYFLAWSFFVFGITCIFFGCTKDLEKKWLFLYGALTVFSGWLISLLWANNYDNALAISFFPALAGVVAISDPSEWRWGVILAGLVAGISYCYPELALFVLGGACLCLCQRIAAAGKPLSQWLVLLLGSAALAALLLVPFAKDAIGFFRGQAQHILSGRGSRPGEGMFPDLLTTKTFLPAFWGLRPRKFPRYVLALALSVLGALGGFGLFRRKDWGLALTLMLPLLGSLFMILYLAYDYGAYKLILANWWVMAFAVITGADLLLRRARQGRHQLGLKIGLFGLFLGISWANGLRLVAFDKQLPEKSILPFKQVQQVESIVGQNGLLVAVDDALANEWAVYFLRDVPVRLAIYRMYMAQPHVVPYMDRAKSIPLGDLRYMLTDKKTFWWLPTDSASLWSGERYRLWKLPGDFSMIRGGFRNESRAGLH